MRFTKNLMMPNTCFHILLGFLLSLGTIGLSRAQTERVTAEEINIQKVFIEANKNKILGAYDEAERLFKEVLDKDKQNHTAAYELSRVYVAKNDYARALENANLALRINDSIPWYHVLKADILEARQEYAKAMEVYGKLTEMQPDEAYYYEHLAEIQEKVSLPEEALETLDRYETVFGIIEPVIRRKFDLLNELGRPEEALAQVDKLIRIYPDELDYRHLAAAYARQVGLDDRANRYYAEILRIDPNDGKANVAMASTFKTGADDLTYLASIHTIIRNPSINVDAKVQELIPYVEKIMEKRDPALEETLFALLTDLEKNHPHDAKVFAIFGDYYNATDQLAKAREAYEKTLAIDDGVFPVWEQLISILASQRDWNTLTRTTETAMDVFPNQGSIYFYNGIGYQMKDDYLEAENAFSQALIMSGRDQVMTYKTLVQLAEVYQALSKYKKADEAFEKALGINGEAFPALNGYAYALALRKDRLEKAASLVEKALQARPESVRGRITKGLILLHTGSPSEARQLLESTEQDAGPDELPLLYDHLGDAFLALDEAETAVLFWQRALDAGSNEERIRKKVNDHKVN